MIRNWMNVAPGERFFAYYMNLRVNYEMPALEAYRQAKTSFAQYPEFMGDPWGTLRRAVQP